jgi:hypothetical protein
MSTLLYSFISHHPTSSKKSHWEQEAGGPIVARVMQANEDVMIARPLYHLLSEEKTHHAPI